MKKFFALAAIFAATMMSFTACEKDPQNGGEQTDPDACETCGKNPCECEEEYVQAITIDGDFSDWAAVEAATATCAADAKYTALKTLKAYADEFYVFLYVEFVEDEIADREWTPFHVYFNADNSDATGGFGDQWTDANAECMLETAIFGSGAYTTYDAALFKWWGEVGGTGWSWTDPSVEHSGDDNWGAVLGEGAGISTAAGAGNAFEISILKEMMQGVEFADTFSVGVDIQQSWSSVGVLPNAASTDENPNGLAPKLVVTTK